MKLGLNQSMRAEQRLVQSPQMIQAMQILQLASMDLQDRIEQELMENPFLEETEGPGEEAATAEQRAEQEPRDRDGADKGVENMLDELERYERDFGDGSRSRTIDYEGADRKLEAMRNTPDRFQSLAEALIDQLAFLDLDERGRAAAVYLIYSLDHRGYLEEPLEEIAAACDLPDVTALELRETLGKIRRVAHPSIGAQDLRECLQLQVEAHGIEDPLVQTLIADHLEDITTNRLPRIAKATGRTIDEVKEAIEVIRHLEPNPGRDYGDEPAAAITPEVVVEEVDGSYEVRLTRQRYPDLTVSPSYKNLLKKDSGEAVQKWIRQRVESARWFIDAVQQRQNTVLKISRAIFRRQAGFLEKGVQALVPLRMQEVADEAGVHISTVSRAVAGKYVQTPRGIFPLKYFFTGGTARSGGGMASQASIKQRIVEIVEAEDSKQPLSDDQIAEQLAERDGIKIARRTVTKYRKALSIPSSGQRKSF